MKKTKLRNIIIATILYILAVLSLVVLMNRNILNNDTNRVLTSANNIQLFMEKHPESTLPSGFEELPASTRNAATENISRGASYSRELTASTITLTVPIYSSGQNRGYLQITENRTPTQFETIAIIVFSALLYAVAAFQIVRRSQRMYTFTENTVAKIKNIERSPMTQSYLIGENDDKITTALNALGETIQYQILSQSEKKENLYEFIEFFQFPIFIYDNKGQIHRTNAAFKNEFADTSNLDVFSPYADFLTFLVDKMLHPDIQEKLFSFDQIGAYYQIRITPLPDLDSRFLVTMMDVTRYYRTVEAHNTFIANVSHELKTPLTSIKGFAELLESDQINTEDRKNFASIIRKESKRLMNLVHDTLLLTKQNQRIEKTKVELNSVIQEIIDTSAPMMAEKSLTLTSNIEPLSLKTNEQMVHSIFQNIIENAIKYTPAQGKIHVELTKSAGKILFSVSDNGPGLTEIQKERIFERFYRVDESRSEVKGTGLGLAIVQKNVQELHGKVEVVSVYGKGTTFTVTL